LGVPLAQAEEGRLAVSAVLGTDSNPYLRDSSSTQQPATALILQTTVDADVKTDAGNRHRLALTVRGQHRYYFDFAGRIANPNRLFLDTALSYRYAARPSLLIGFVQTTSYARMQLFDTEGNTLPRDLFSSWSGETRGYAQFLARRYLATIGAGIRVRDVNETEGQASLDQDGYFVSLDGTVRIAKAMVTLGYEYAVTHYDVLQALPQDPAPLTAANPPLTLVQNAARSRIDIPFGARTKLGLDARQRWVIDPFEGDLTYRQTDVTPTAQFRLPMDIVWDLSVGRRTRVYPGRDARERFLVADTSLRKNWTTRWASILQIQDLRKGSTILNDEFRERLYLLGVSVTF
jgi:hypothetical protein